jgi:hypothetical protein
MKMPFLGNLKTYCVIHFFVANHEFIIKHHCSLDLSAFHSPFLTLVQSNGSLKMFSAIGIRTHNLSDVNRQPVTLPYTDKIIFHFFLLNKN